MQNKSILMGTTSVPHCLHVYNMCIIAVLLLYVTVHVKRYHKSANFFFRLRWISHLQVRPHLRCKFGAYSPSRCRDTDPEQRKLRSPKRQFLYVSNFFVYASVTRCVYSDPRLLGFVAMRDVGQGKEVTAR